MTRNAGDSTNTDREVLRGLRSKSHGDVVALLASSDTGVQLAAIMEIGRRRPPDVHDALRTCFGSSHETIREAAIGVLARVEPAESRDLFFEALNDRSPTVRRLGVRGLAAARDPRAGSLAHSLYSDGGTVDKQEALDALVSIGDDDARGVLEDLASAERSWWWRRRLHKSLKKIRLARAAS